MSYWNTKKDIFLNKAKVQLLGFEYKNTFQKEIDLLICGAILRYCIDQGFIKDQAIRKSLNSIIHASNYIELTDGTILIKSEYELKDGKDGIKVDSKFINSTIQSIEKALIEKLKIEKEGENELLIF